MFQEAEQNTNIMDPEQPRKASFMDLPPEIRILIYDFYLPIQVSIQYHAHYSEPSAPPAIKYWCSQLPRQCDDVKWLQLNHPIRAEYCHELSRRRFVIDEELDHGRHGGRQFPTWLRDVMQDVRIGTFCKSRFERSMPKHPSHFLMSRSLEHHWQVSKGSQNIVEGVGTYSLVLLDHLKLKKLTLSLRHPSAFEAVPNRHHVTSQLPVALPNLLYNALQRGSIQELHVFTRDAPKRFVEHLLRVLDLRQMLNLLPFAETDSLVQVLHTDKSGRKFRGCLQQNFHVNWGYYYHTTNIRIESARLLVDQTEEQPGR